jgi:hypothetical protein
VKTSASATIVALSQVTMKRSPAVSTAR